MLPVGSQLLQQVGRRPGQQHTQCVDRLPGGGLEHRNLRFSRCDIGIGVGDVKGAGKPCIRFLACDQRRVLHRFQIILRDYYFLLITAELNIVERHFGGEADLRVADAFDGSLDIGVGRFDITALPAEQVEFPCRIEACLIEILRMARRTVMGTGVSR